MHVHRASRAPRRDYRRGKQEGKWP